MCSIVIRPTIGLWSQGRLLPPDTSLRLEMFRNNLDHVLITGDTQTQFKLNIRSACLYACYVEVQKSIVKAHKQILSSGRSLRYPHIVKDCISFSLAKGSTSLDYPNLALGKNIVRFVVAFVESKVYHGTRGIDCHQYIHNNLSSIHVQVIKNLSYWNLFAVLQGGHKINLAYTLQLCKVCMHRQDRKIGS